MLNHSSLYINIMCEAKSIQSDILNGRFYTRVKYRTMAIILRKIFTFVLKFFFKPYTASSKIPLNLFAEMKCSVACLFRAEFQIFAQSCREGVGPDDGLQNKLSQRHSLNSSTD